MFDIRQIGWSDREIEGDGGRDVGPRLGHADVDGATVRQFGICSEMNDDCGGHREGRQDRGQRLVSKGDVPD